RRHRRQAHRGERHQSDWPGGDRRAERRLARGARRGLRARARRIARARRGGYVRTVTKLAAIAVLLFALGCGSGSVGGTFNGVVREQPMKPADAISSPARVSLGSISANVGAIVLTDVPGVCGRVTANSEPKNGKALVLFIA